ncbi:MAG: TetR/AcrR family transcriptional regulator [Myxococcota bacterium]
MSSSSSKSSRGRKYAGRSPEERRAERRERLLRSGLELFGTQGYPTTSIERLCSHARVTARHFYEEFPSRESLLLAVMDRVMETVMEATVRATERAPVDVRSRVRSGVAAFVHAMLDDPRRARIACVETVGVSPDLEKHRREWMHSFARLVEAQGQILTEAGQAPEQEYYLGALMLVGGTNELIVDWLSHSPPPPLDNLIRAVSYMFEVMTLGRSDSQ